jgi:hypothetical protein
MRAGGVQAGGGAASAAAPPTLVAVVVAVAVVAVLRVDEGEVVEGVLGATIMIGVDGGAIVWLPSADSRRWGRPLRPVMCNYICLVQGYGNGLRRRESAVSNRSIETRGEMAR